MIYTTMYNNIGDEDYQNHNNCSLFDWLQILSVLTSSVWSTLCLYIFIRKESKGLCKWFGITLLIEPSILTVLFEVWLYPPTFGNSGYNNSNALNNLWPMVSIFKYGGIKGRMPYISVESAISPKVIQCVLFTFHSSLSVRVVLCLDPK